MNRTQKQSKVHSDHHRNPVTTLTYTNPKLYYFKQNLRPKAAPRLQITPGNQKQEENKTKFKLQFRKKNEKKKSSLNPTKRDT